VDEVGVFTPKRVKTTSLKAGEVGFLIANIKNIDGAPVGDTITSVKNPHAMYCP
jgi:GTP-binding protein LepA